jgi:hypothetical protein
MGEMMSQMVAQTTTILQVTYFLVFSISCAAKFYEKQVDGRSERRKEISRKGRIFTTETKYLE